MRQVTAHRARRALAVASGLALTGVLAWTAFDRYDDRRVAASVLNIDSLPGSVQDVECESWGWTDVLTTCAFEVAPRDFGQLLAGRPFEVLAPCRLTAHEFGGGPEVGPDFQAATCLEARPEAFAHGGHVRLAADEQRRRALIDIYVE